VITFRCPRCKNVLTRDDPDAGSKLECPSCGQRLQVPRPSADDVLIGQWVPPDPADEEVVAAGQCPSCTQPLTVPRKHLGASIQCPDCGCEFTAGQSPIRAIHTEPIAHSPLARELFPHHGGQVLALGLLSVLFAILSIFFLTLVTGLVAFILGIVGWRYARTDLRQIEHGLMDPAGRAMTEAGKVCAEVGTILSGLTLAAYAVALAVYGAFLYALFSGVGRHF
jgi:DNA-directed RNA polymerase subunit M/transcription elongation factor TFIIS